MIGKAIGNALAKVIEAAIRRNEPYLQGVCVSVMKLADGKATGMVDSVEETADAATRLLSRWRRLLRVEISFRWRNLFLPGKPVISFVPVFGDTMP
jgi:hypothetical protein